MSILENTYDDVKGSDSSGSMTATVLECTVGKPEIKKNKTDGKDYISFDLAYKDNDDEWRYLRFQNFNPEKSSKGAQLWKNVLIVAGAKSGNDLTGRKIKAVVRPEPYDKSDGSEGMSYKVFEMGYFSSTGLSAGEIERDVKEGEKMMEALGRAVDNPAVRESAPQAASEKNDDDDMPF